MEFGVIRKVPATNLARGCKGSLDVIPVHALVITSYCSAVLFIYSLFLSSLFWISIVNSIFDLCEVSEARPGAQGLAAAGPVLLHQLQPQPRGPAGRALEVQCLAELS